MKKIIITSLLLGLLFIDNNTNAQVPTRPSRATATGNSRRPTVNGRTQGRNGNATASSTNNRRPNGGTNGDASTSSTNNGQPNDVTNGRPRTLTFEEAELTADKLAAIKAQAKKEARAELEAEYKAAADKATTEKAIADKLTADKVATDKAAADKATADKSVADKLKESEANSIANATAFNNYVKSLDYDPRLLLAVEGDGGTLLQEKPVDTSTKRTPDPQTKKITICTTSKYSMSNNFDEVVVMQPTNGIVYPGALIYADKNLVRGQPRPLTNLPLGSIELTLDLPGIGNRGTFVVKNPSNGAVQTQLDDALKYWNENSAYKEGYVNAARSSSSAAILYNSEQLALSLGVNVKWATGNAAAQFKFNTNSKKRVAVMMFKQVFYTVTSAPPANPSNAFAPEVTAVQAQSAFSKETPPAYIQSVSYGRIIMFRLETSEQATDGELEASFKYATGAIDVAADAKAKYEKILNSSTITYALLGGNGEVLSDIASATNLKDIEPLIKGKNSVYSKTNPGVPISYTVRFLKDQSIAKMGTTTEYTKENCVDVANIYVKLIHSGAYIAKYELTYNDQGTEVSPPEVRGDKGAGWTQTVYLPSDATNIRLKAWAATGIAWDYWQEIYNKILQPSELNKCITNTGTTLNRHFAIENCQ